MIKVHTITNPKDLATAFDIRRRVFVIEQYCPPDEEYDEYETTSTHFLAVNKGLDVGTCRYRETKNGFKLERFAVLKEHRTYGVGAALLINCLKILAQKPFIYLHSQEHAMNFYKKYNFFAEGERFFEAGIPHFKMIFRP